MSELIKELAEQSGFENGHQDRYGNSLSQELEKFANLVAEKEREACANICETLELPDWPDKVRQPLAQAIRARGQA
jgi:hypothetical protein